MRSQKLNEILWRIMRPIHLGSESGSMAAALQSAARRDHLSHYFTTGATQA